MHIILVSSKLAKARSLTLTNRHLVASVVFMALLVFSLTLGLFWITVRHATEFKLPLLDSLVLSAQEAQRRKTEEFLRENLNAMAVKLGQMQAQLMRLDALGERLSTLAGLKPGEFRFNEAPGRGGAVSSIPAQDFSMAEFNRQLDQLSRQMENRSDSLGILESQLFDAKVKKKLMPTIPPVDAAYSASSYGWRIDPFTGQKSFHEGLDFPTEPGTPIVAAASGKVIFADVHPQYGKMIEIDHGNGLVTRYAHCSMLLVKEGDLVVRGQKVAAVGSTGRATGPHLHFEVRLNGAPQNPARFLQSAS
ncbi:MAG: M23 family peptidase [Betaproteobacteria bacterium]|nr:MAG: M23 family peptidase [Betaproteobacteria bacterium]